MLQPKDDSVVNYRKGDKQIWETWKDKSYGQRTKKEQEQCNLMLLPKSCLDLDPDSDEAEKLIEEGIKNEELTQYIKIGVEGRRPHYIIEYKSLDKYDGEVLKEIKRKIIQRYKCDEQMLVNATIIPNKPHHKSGQIVKVFKEVKGINEIPEEFIKVAKEIVQKDIELASSKPIQSNEEFKDYFEKDPFWIELNTIDWSKLPMKDMGFNLIVMKNIGIAASKSGKSKKEVENLVKSLCQKTHYDYSAFENGWYKKGLNGTYDEYNKNEINQWHRQYIDSTKDLYNMYEVLEIEEVKTPSEVIITDEQLSTMPQEKQEWIIEKTLPKNAIEMIASPPGIGKSFMALNWAICIASGKKVFDKYEVLKSRVLIIDEENGKAITKDRSAWIREGLGIGGKGLSNLGYTIFQQIMFENGGLLKVMKIIEHFKPEVLIIDTMRNVTDIDENDSKQAMQFLKGLKLLQQKYNLTILLIHHTRKSNPKYENTGTIDDFMGSRAISGKVDAAILLQAAGKAKFTILRTKIRGIEPQNPETIIIDNTKDENDITKSVKFRIALNEEVELDKEVVCANKLKVWFKESNIDIFATKDAEVAMERFRVDGNIVGKALRLLKSDNKIELAPGYKKGKYKVRDDIEDLTLDNFDEQLKGGQEITLQDGN